VLAHQASDLLVIDDHPSMSQLGVNPPSAVAFELFADGRDRFDDCGIVGRRICPEPVIQLARAKSEGDVG
jgi:hypothetical protein